MAKTGYFPFDLKTCATAGASVEALDERLWRLGIPPGGNGYCLAQLDDYHERRRRDFPRRSPFRLQLKARASAAEIPGTWGFGLWNDPFGMGLALTEPRLRIPALPNTAWFFFASPPNSLSLRDDLPAHGATAGTFRSPRIPTPLLALSAPVLPLLGVPLAARLLRRLAQPIVRQSAVPLNIDPTNWHSYRLEWQPATARFFVDEATVLETHLSPLGPLGLVIWIDNQYMAFPPDGRVRFGVLPVSEPHWIEIAGLHLGE